MAALCRLWCVASIATILLFTSSLHSQHIHWMQPQNPLAQPARAIQVDQDFVYSISDYVFSRSHINGGGWRVLHDSIRVGRIETFVVQDKHYILALENGTVLESLDAAQSWTTSSLNYTHARKLLAWNGTIVLLADSHTLYFWNGIDHTWETTATPTERNIDCISTSQTDLYCVSDGYIWLRSSPGSAWVQKWATPKVNNCKFIQVSLPSIIIANDSLLFRNDIVTGVWTVITPNQVVPNAEIRLSYDWSTLCVVKGSATSESPSWIWYSTDFGVTWKTPVDNWLTAIYAVAYKNDIVVLTKEGHVYDLKPKIPDVLDLCALPVSVQISILATSSTTDFIAHRRDVVKRLRSMDEWLPVTLPQTVVNDAAFVEDRLISCGEGPELAYSDDAGLSWFPQLAPTLPSNAQWKRIDYSSGRAYLHSQSGELFISEDFTATWSKAFADNSIDDFSIQSKQVAAITSISATNACAVLMTSTASAKVDSVYVQNHQFKHLALCSNGILLAYDSLANTLYRSADSGRSWQLVDLPDSISIQCIAAKAELCVIGTKHDGIYISSDAGIHWSVENFGLRELNVRRIAFRDNYIYAVGDTSGLYYGIYQNEIINDVESDRRTEKISQVLSLEQALALTSLYPQSQLYLYALDGECRWSGKAENFQRECSQLSMGIYGIVIAEYHINRIMLLNRY